MTRADDAGAAVRAIRAWYRLDRAFAEVNRKWKAEHGVTGLQVALLRIVGERESWPLGDLRGHLTMHPATLGQALDRLAVRGLVEIAPDLTDRRRRRVAITDAGRALAGAVPLLGPVRLRATQRPDESPSDRLTAEQLELLAEAFDLAVDAFGLAPFAPKPTAPEKKERQA